MTEGQQDASDDTPLGALIRADQCDAICRSVRIAVPVNMLLGLIGTLVSWRYGRGLEGAVWFCAAATINIARFVLCGAALPGRPDVGPAAAGGRLDADFAIERRLRRSWLLALLSGFVWALVPVLCDGYTTPQTLFYLTVVCGITAGAVTHGTAYARVPICFSAPPLLAVCGCLLYAGGFDRNCLAATVLLYLAALIRSARQSEAGFRETSRLKNEATVLAHSLAQANATAVAVAEQMSHRAAHDPLTGLLNRAGFMNEVERRPAVARSTHGLMMLDLDGFKTVNDVFGHKTGDRVLVEVARRLRDALPADWPIARLGGDEFAVFYEADASGETPKALAGRVIAAIAAPFDACRLGTSIGIHVSQSVDIADMLVCADEALYAAKSAGRNTSCLFDDALRSRLEMRRDVERDLLGAIDEGTVEVWFQPVFGQGGRSLTSLEALVRWNHPNHGWIPPQDLIATAAMAGLSEPLLRFILGQACSMLRTLPTLGLDHVVVSMNVSPREMSQMAVDDIVLDRLRAAQIPPSKLEIEITEETAVDGAAVQDRVAALSRAGVRIAIDDFGVGYSCLAALRHLHVDRVKIDRCFVSGISRSAEDQALVQAVLSLGRSLKFDVVAEGVETIDDLRVLQAVGCPFMQGYYLGRAMPSRALVDWIRRSESTAA